MKLEYVPTLKIQRELQGMPRNRERFRKYLQTITANDGATLELPSLVIMNPMGKEHVTALLDALLELNADGYAAHILGEAAAEYDAEPWEFKATTVIADDLKGGWTNRFDSEYSLRFPRGSGSDEPRLPRWLKHYWLTGVLWSSEASSLDAVREALLTAFYRSIYRQRHGSPQTLAAMLAQEGQIMAKAGCTRPSLDAEDIAYTREVIKPYLDATDKRTIMECLFGDEAGRTLGFTPRGLSPWAGIALALHDARTTACGV